MPIEPESIDLARIVGELTRVFAGNLPPGYLLGRTAMRDVVTQFLACSQLEAEQVVDTMIARGFLKYEGAPSNELDVLESSWIIVQRPPP